MRRLLLACTLLVPFAARAGEPHKYYSAFAVDEVAPDTLQMPLEDGWPYEKTTIFGMIGKPPKSGSFVETLKIDGKPACTVTITPKNAPNKPIMCGKPVEVMCHQVVEIEISAVKGHPKNSGVGFTWTTERKPCPDEEKL